MGAVADMNDHHLCVASSADVAEPSSSSSSSMSADISRFEPVMSSSDTVNDAAIESTASMFVTRALHPNSSARRQIQSWGPTSPEIPEPHESKKLLPQPTKLPEKYEILAQFYDSLETSIRLLRLKGSSSSFTNICPKIECLTDRRFTHRHLAQLKFILRDAIEIKRVLVFDERTSCMKPDLHVSINVDAVENDGKLKSDSGYMHLWKVLRSRLADFSKSCPEVDEIPEELLPEPFNRKKLDVLSFMKTPTSSFRIMTPASSVRIMTPTSSFRIMTPTSALQPAVPFPRVTSPVVASHLSQSFHKRFSQKVISQ